MKKFISLFASVAAVLVLASCNPKKTINDATTFTIDYSAEVQVPAVTVTVSGTQDYTTPDIPTTSSARYVTEGTTPALIDKISLTRFNISATGTTLDFVKSVNITMQASGLPDVSVASKTVIPAGSSSIDCDLSGTNIKDYIAKDNFKLKATITFEKAQTADCKLKFEQSIKVEGKKI